MIYDVIVMGAGAAGLYVGICLDKNLKKVVLEKTARPGIKVLMSGGERANVSNADIEPMRDYFTQNKKFLLSIFSRYTNWDILSFFAENGVQIVEEDRTRLILESGDSKELLDCLLRNLKNNNCDLQVNCDVKSIEKLPSGCFEIALVNGKKYKAKNVIVASGGKSFPQIGTTGEAYNIAKTLGLQIVTPYRTLCGMATKNDLSEISGVSADLQMKLYDKSTQKKYIYSEKGPLLFTHFGVSGPIVHNVSNAVGEYLNSKKLSEQDFEKYILENMYLELTFDIAKTPKRVVKFFELSEEKMTVELGLQNWRSWREAKATGGGVATSNLNQHMEVKQIPGLYFIGEAVDVTGKTGGFNLQWAWSSSFVAAEHINKKI